MATCDSCGNEYMFCCAHCAQLVGVTALADQA
jgi:hypothetical protein